MHDITTKIQHKVGFANTQKIVSFKSISSEVYFWRENLDEISPGQIGYCALVQTPLNMVHIPFGELTNIATKNQTFSKKLL